MPSDLSHSRSSSLFLGDEDDTCCLGEPVQIVGKVIDKDCQRNGPLQRIQPTNPKASQTSTPQYRWEIKWGNIFKLFFLHIAGLIGLYQLVFHAKWKTVLCTYLVYILGGLGTTVGAHRLWTHRSYKAKLPLRIILALCQTLALQNDIYDWVRDHRVHHKFTDTDADPHNVKRGFFFSHIGWLLIKKHKDVRSKGKIIDMSDVAADPVVRFQIKYYIIVAPILAFALPAWIPWYFWNEDMFVAFFASVLRYVLSLHSTWLVNSAAHTYGTRPYDKSMNPAENLLVSIITYGEGWHNYHHVFPWDYKAAELGTYSTNMGTAFIDAMAKIGWAYDLKSVSAEMVQKRIARTGDFSFLNHDNHHGNNEDESVWGWGDTDMKSDEVDLVKIQYRARD